MEFYANPGAWRQVPDGSGVACNRTRIGWVSGKGGCGKPAAYQLSLAGLVVRNCMAHHRVAWRGTEQQDGTIVYRPHDPYKDPKPGDSSTG